MLREAFSCALSNQALVTELESQQRPVNVMQGAEYADAVDALLDASPEFEAAIKEAF